MEHCFIAMTPSHSDFYASADDFSSEDESLQVINAAGSSVVKPRTNWLDELSELPSDWALLPLDGNKRPIDPASGLLMKGWPSHKGFSSDELQDVMPLAVGVLLGPISGGLLAVDFDGPG